MRARGQRGFSLVEVVLALGLLAAVLVSISSLFVFGRGLLKSGKTHTAALSVARDIMEEMDGWSYRRLYTAFGVDGSAAAYTFDSTSNARAAEWQAELDEQMRDGLARIELQSVAEAGSPPLASAESVRIVVTVSWREGLRQRRLRLATVRN